MSWDIFVQDLPPNARATKDIPDDFSPQAIGRRADVVRQIMNIVPSVDFSGPTWGRIETDQYLIEINLGDTDPVQSFAFHVRGGPQAAGVVADILDELKLRALDPGAPGGIFTREAARDSMSQWRKYRDEVLGP